MRTLSRQSGGASEPDAPTGARDQRPTAVEPKSRRDGQRRGHYSAAVA
jgi:hypothetical protein